MIVHILLCDAFEGILPRDISSYPQMFIDLFDAVMPGISYRTYDVTRGELPVPERNGNLYLITGSRAGAYDPFPWIDALKSFIREGHRKEARLAGICFGHQVVAEALGGKVEKSPLGWGLGVRTARVRGKSEGDAFPEGTLNLVCSHQDQVVRLPSEAVLFAESDFCPNEGFTVGKHILTFQGHPEFSTDYSRYLLVNHCDDVPEKTRVAALDSLDRPTHHREAALRMVSP